MKTCSLRTYVRRHFEGTISPRAERSMREHLPDCDACRKLYCRHLVLSRLDPMALPAEERLARGLGFGSRLGRRARMGLGLVAVAALLLLVPKARTSGFSPRGHIGEGARRASRVLVYDVPERGMPTSAAGVLRRGDELAFSYENGSAKPRLAIFGVDEHGHVFWFHPAWTKETDDPVAIPVETDDRRHELPEAIRQRFDGTRLEIEACSWTDQFRFERSKPC